uniref:Uncharacterized protein n=1 Tax=Timema shepardi TaxID=629360 RepID=A0A7R9AN04_TIMSH|nr:unnamed protein product [Timema shepardi]
MAEKIKKFFQKKKADAKFKMAGPGYKLNAAAPQPKVEASSTTKVTPRGPLSDEAKQAAAAALSRLGGQKQGTAAFNTSLAAIQAQVCRELEAEKKERLIEEEVPKSGVDTSAGDDENLSPFLAVNGVYFKCPLIARRFVDIDLPPTCHAEDKPTTRFEDDEDEVFFGFDNTVEAHVPSPDGLGEDGDISSVPDDTAPNTDVSIAVTGSWETHLFLHVQSFRGGRGFGADSWPISAFGLASVFDLYPEGKRQTRTLAG